MDYAKFQAMSAEILGISVNASHSQAIFAQMLKLEFPLLSDFRMQAMRAYGVKNPKREMALRSWFIVDKEGKIRFKYISKGRGDILSNDRLLRALAAMEG